MDLLILGSDLTANFGSGFFFSWSYFKALAKALFTISCLASSDNSALESDSTFCYTASIFGTFLDFLTDNPSFDDKSALTSCFESNFLVFFDCVLFWSSFKAFAKASLTIFSFSSSDNPSLLIADSFYF